MTVDSDAVHATGNHHEVVGIHIMPPSNDALSCLFFRGECTGEGAEGHHASCQLASRFPPLQCKEGWRPRGQTPGQIPLLHGEGLGWFHRPQRQHQAWGLDLQCLQPAQLCQKPRLFQVWSSQNVSSLCMHMPAGGCRWTLAFLSCNCSTTGSTVH